MKTSLDGCLSIISFEGIVLETYSDSAGVLTIGVGHTRAAGNPVPVSGMRITIAEAIRLFQRDLIKYEEEVRREIDVKLSQSEFDALVSWHFNTGRVANATLSDKLNADDRAGAAKEFAKWNKSKGKVLDGLVKRRAREKSIFENGDYGNDPIAVQQTGSSPPTAMTRKELTKLLSSFETPDALPTPNDEEHLSTEELLANPASALLPNNRPRQSDAVTRATVEKFRHLLPETRRFDAVYVLAIRGYYTDTLGRPGVNDRGLYDDAIFVVEPSAVHNFNGNTDPSRFRAGIAKLKSPQAILYKPGLHGYNRNGGPYPAFRQASPCTVVRDQVGEDTDNGRPSYFWINLHRGGNTTTSSAGCQTVPPNQWIEFKSLIDRLLKQHGQQNFYYILVDEADKAKVTDMSATPSGQGMPTDSEKLVAAVQAIAELLNRPDGGNATNTPAAGDASAVDRNTNVAAILAALVTVLGQLNNNQTVVDPAPAVPPEKPDLTPVNAALGQTVGTALNGRKTVAGTLGLLATTLIPALVPVIPGLGPAAAIVTEVAPVAVPLLSALTGWGVLGKIDKWFQTRG